MSNQNDGDDRDPTARLALGAVGLVVALVLGFQIYDSLRHSPAPDDSRADGLVAPTSPPVSSGRSFDAVASPTLVATPGILELESWRELLARDPRAAAISLAQMPTDAERDSRMVELMAHWTAQAPDAAGAWLLEQPSGSFRTDSSVEFSRAWADRDPVSAARWIGARHDNPAAIDAVGGLLARWARSDAPAALAWVESLPPGAARTTAGAALAYTWVQKDARAAAEWVAQIDSPELLASASRNLVNAWSASDPPAAANWLSANLRDPALRDAAALPLILTWADIDPHAASKWVAALPGGELQEQSKAIFAEALAAESPVDAITWAKSIDDPEQRHESILNIYEDWMDNDKPALLAHLRSSMQGAPDLRDKIFGILYENDPDFRSELIELYDGNNR